MTERGRTGRAQARRDELQREIDGEQAYLDRVYTELDKASRRAALVRADGFARARTDRTGDVREEELTGLFERDALVYRASQRQRDLETQYEGLVFGRLDLESAPEPGPQRRGGRAAAGRAGGVASGNGPAGVAGGNGPDGVASGNGPGGNGPGENGPGAEDDAAGGGVAVRETRYVGRLGVRDDDYEPLVIDWRAPAAAPFYRATPAAPLGVLRRRVLQCRGDRVIGVEDDLLVPEAPDDLVVVGDGALIAALGRARGPRMRDIVATIQAHQDEAIRAPARGVTEITGGPGTGKTVVALHRAAYLLYSERRRFEAGGVLVVGPSAAYTAYIERVLPSLGEDSVVLRSMGDLVDAISTGRLDPPAVAAVKGSLRMRRVLSRLARLAVPDAPTMLRTFVAGQPIRLEQAALDRVRGQVLRHHQRNGARQAARTALGHAAWAQVGRRATVEREEFLDTFGDHLDVEAFLDEWWPALDPRQVLLWLADPEVARSVGAGILSGPQIDDLSASLRQAVRVGQWSVADVALVDDLSHRLGVVPEQPSGEREFHEIDELDDVSLHGVRELGLGYRQSSGSPGFGGSSDESASAGSAESTTSMAGSSSYPAGSSSNRAGASYPAGLDPAGTHLSGLDPDELDDRRLEALLRGRIDRPREYAHVLVDEAQDVSPMQWRMLARRGRGASWTVVGDAAQSSWPDEAEAAQARRDAFARLPVQGFRLDVNYRNAAEIFGYAADVILPVLPNADIPQAVRTTGVAPVELSSRPADLADLVADSARSLLDEVEGTVAVIAPTAWRQELGSRLNDHALADGSNGRVLLVDPLSTKGLEYDATVVVDPGAIVAESPGGHRALYVTLTRAAHRMHVLRPD